MHAEPEKLPSNALATDEQDRLWLSACADGDERALDPACRLWRDDAVARQTWHRYHLIGDVMRSAELASVPARDAAFVAGVRARLVAEPVRLAPAALVARGAGAAPVAPRPAWRLPAAIAASVVLVAGALIPPPPKPPSAAWTRRRPWP